MSASAQIEIAASPEEVRRVFLDFANWAKIGDDRLKSLTPVSDSDPVAEGSKVIGEFGGIKTVVVITENSPQTFSWRGDAFYILSGDHTFKFLPSEITPGHTTFVNSEKFAKMLWVLLTVGVLKAQANFQAFCEKFKKRVEEELGVRRWEERVQ